ncbi:MAG TPA: chemotaxis protein CheX [Acidobacteriaceae bacterium]|nr:chemotaxis protein CheX [Acidobacteriaceae bacterium]
MDDAVGEVFQAMLDRSCTAVDEPLAIPGDYSARISISGAFEANCSLEFPASSAQQLTGALLGPSDTAYDSIMVIDAVGELCNMIAGGWKRRIGPQADGLILSLPLPCGEPNHTAEAANNIRRAYVFDDSRFVVNLDQF